jgi:hypothetical protein
MDLMRWGEEEREGREGKMSLRDTTRTLSLNMNSDAMQQACHTSPTNTERSEPIWKLPTCLPHIKIKIFRYVHGRRRILQWLQHTHHDDAMIQTTGYNKYSSILASLFFPLSLSIWTGVVSFQLFRRRRKSHFPLISYIGITSISALVGETVTVR